MPLRKNTPYPVGYLPGGPFHVRAPEGIQVGIITRVDPINMKVDIHSITGTGDHYEVDITQAMAGPRTFWGGVPEVNSMVLLGYRKVGKLIKAMILGYLPMGNRTGTRFDPFVAYDPTITNEDTIDDVERLYGPITRYKRLQLQSGDVGGMSYHGAEFRLSKDVQLVNRAGDALELRDSDRTLILQAIHKVDAQAGSRVITGPIRRSDFWLPHGLVDENRTISKEGYKGTKTLQDTGPDNAKGGPYKYVSTEDKLGSWLNNPTEQPPVTYSSGKRSYYPTTLASLGLEDPDGIGSLAYVEHRMELSHTTDLIQEILGEIDGFTIDSRIPYIEQVFGTVVGNDSMSSRRGLRQYGKILAPKLFEDFGQRKSLRLKWNAIDRNPLRTDLEVDTLAGAYSFKIRSPRATNEGAFAVAISKQGKLFAVIPGSKIEKCSSGTKNISAELAFEGAIKSFIGATQPDRVSVNMTTDGAVHMDLGVDKDGNSLVIKHAGAIKYVHTESSGTDEQKTAMNMEVQGDKYLAVKGHVHTTIEGSEQTVVRGKSMTRADSVTVNSSNGYTVNAREWNSMISGKSQYHYALAVTETIVAGGKTSTVLAGGRVTTTAAGAVVDNVLGGAKTTNVAAGAYTVSVGTGAISITTGAGAISITTGAGALSLASAGVISISAGLAVNIASPVATIITSPQVLLGAAVAPLGVCRGTPNLPPGSPTLDPITGAPLMGSALVRSV